MEPGIDYVPNSNDQISIQLSDTGYAIADVFLPLDVVAGMLSELQAESSEGHFHKAGVGQAEDYRIIHTVRGDYIRWLDQDDRLPFTSQYLQALDNLILKINRTCYLGIKDKEVHFTQYPPGTGYLRHVDAFKEDDNRRLSAVFYLNFDWTDSDGGQLIIYPKRGSTGEVSILPEAGRLVLFESYLEHEVLPSIKKRYSVTGWLLKERKFF
jgi:SM-20-related protein